MNAQQIQNQEIWKKVKGADELFEVYAYFPALHDAKIRNVDTNFEKREFYLTVDYCDFIKEPGDEILTRFTLRWQNVQKATFDWYAEDLYGMKFSKEQEFIKTIFESYPFGFDGEITAGEIEVTNIQIEPERGDSQGNHIKFTIK